ncbi:MAG: 50S ribosomal protein L13 [Candidatus Bathyarchaeia archaeon]
MSGRPVVIDAANLVLGRVLSYAAKRALEGQDVVLLNVSKAVISGRKQSIVQRAKTKLRTRTLASQEKGPRHPRRAETYARRALRGMLPFKKPLGKRAYKRVRIYAGIPSGYEKIPPQKIPGADASKLRCPYILVEEYSREIGGL